MMTVLSDTILNARFGKFSEGFEYRAANAQGGDETMAVLAQPDGTYAVKSPNGQEWLSIQPDGSMGWRPTSDPTQPGPWEKFSLVGHVLTELPKDGITRALVQLIVRDDLDGHVAPTPERLHVGRLDFRNAQNHPVFLKLATSFLAYKRFLDGNDLGPHFQELQDLGCNGLVVFGMVVGFDVHLAPDPNFAKFRPQEYESRGYYTRLQDFCRLCASYGFYVYWCMFADTQHIMPNYSDQRRHFDRVDAELAQVPNTLLRLVNEQNAHENGVERARFATATTRPYCTMDYGEEYGGNRYPPPYGDFGDNHTPRSYPKCVKDICQADNPNYLAGECTIVGEPLKFGARDKYNGRTYETSPRLAKEAAGTALGTCAAIDYHSTDGTYSEVMEPDVKATAAAWFGALQGI